MINWKNWRTYYVNQSVDRKICNLLNDFKNDLSEENNQEVWGDIGADAMHEILELAIANINKFKPIGLSMSIHRLAHISKKAKGLEEWLHNYQNFVNAWIEVTTAKLGLLNPQELANSIWALATLGHHHQGFETAWIAIATGKLRQFNPQNLANGIWALATIGHHNQGFENAWITIATGKLRQFSPQDLANSIWALATLNHHHQGFENAWIETAIKQLGQFNPQNLANSIWALATLGHYHQGFENVWIETATGKLDKFVPQALANSIWALATLGHCDKNFETAWIYIATRQLGQFTCQNLANSIWALAILDHHHHQGFENVWITIATGKLEQFNPQNLANSIWALATLGHHHQGFENAWVAIATGKLGQFNPQNLANSIWALATLNHHHQDFENAWIATAIRQLGRFNLQNLANSIWALAKLSINDKQLASCLFDQLKKRVRYFNDYEGKIDSIYALEMVRHKWHDTQHLLEARQELLAEKAGEEEENNRVSSADANEHTKDNRPLSKFAAAREFEEGSEHRTAVYSDVHEDSSTEQTHKLPATIEFRRRSNEVVDIAQADTLGVIKKEGSSVGVKLHQEAQGHIVKYMRNYPNKSEDSNAVVVQLLELLNKLVPEITNGPDEKRIKTELYLSSVESVFKNIKSRNILLIDNTYIALQRHITEERPVITGVKLGGHGLSSFVGRFVYRLDIDLLFKKLLYRQELERFVEIVSEYGIELPLDLKVVDVLLDNSKFNKLVMNRIHPDKNPFGADVAHDDTLFVMELRSKFTADLNVKKLLGDGIAKANSVLYKTSIWFKALDVVVDSAWLICQPTIVQAKKLIFDYAYLRGMVVGVNHYTIAISGAEVVYQMHMGEYQKAFDVAAGTLNAMALSFILALAPIPYLGFVYGVWVAVSTAYNAIANAYSFAEELTNGDAALRSSIAYKELIEWIAASPLKVMYDFEAYSKEYEVRINNMLFEKETLTIQTQLKEKEEFGQKIFNYIYLPALTEKYALLNDIIKGTLTMEEADILRAKHITITASDRSYDHCMEIKDVESMYVTDANHYYCYNNKKQLLERVLVGNDNHFEVLERL